MLCNDRELPQVNEIQSQIQGAAKPTIYADMNVFRYLANDELKIENPDEFLWVYSGAHLDEIHRGESFDTLDGMRTLQAVEITELYDNKVRPTGIVQLNDYVDPEERYQSHLEAISDVDLSEDLLLEPLLRICGADNYDAVKQNAQLLTSEVDRLTQDADAATREQLLQSSGATAADFDKLVEEHLQDVLPIDDTRKLVGINSGVREQALKSKAPLEKLWETVKDQAGGVTMNQFFGFEEAAHTTDDIRTQHGMLTGAYMSLNIAGLAADKGLSKKKKLKNVLSDSQHLGMASYCDAFMTSDKKFALKTAIIFSHLKYNTNVLWYPYRPEGITLRLGTSVPDKETS